jgi:hypothetical protein
VKSNNNPAKTKRPVKQTPILVGSSSRFRTLIVRYQIIIMNGNDIKKAAINKAKQVASAANNATNGNGGKKRRKGQDLKPIITTEAQQAADLSPNSSVKMSTTRSVGSSDCMA